MSPQGFAKRDLRRHTLSKNSPECHPFTENRNAYLIPSDPFVNLVPQSRPPPLLPRQTCSPTWMGVRPWMLGALGGTPAWSSASTSFTQPRAAAVASKSDEGSMPLGNTNTLARFLPPSAARPSLWPPARPSASLRSALADSSCRVLLPPPQSHCVLRGGAFHSEQAANATPLQSPRCHVWTARPPAYQPEAARSEPDGAVPRRCCGCLEPVLTPTPCTARQKRRARVSGLVHSTRGKFLPHFLLPMDHTASNTALHRIPNCQVRTRPSTASSFIGRKGRFLLARALSRICTTRTTTSLPFF